MSRFIRFATLAIALLMIAALATPAVAQQRVLNIYSARHYGAIEAPFQAFEEDTGIEVRLSQGAPRALLERLRAEGDRTPADLFLAIDAGVLSLAAEEGLLQSVDSEILTANIDESQRDPDGQWFALSQRVRTVVYNPANVGEEEIAQLNNYADLANPIWAGRICQRPAAHIYTVSLTSSLIYHLGEDEARAVVEGIVANEPTYINSDTRQIEAVAAGECDVAVVNHYYMGRLLDTGELEEGEVVVKWMNQDTTGTFYNINGAGVTANAENAAEAIEFLEYFSTLEGQAGTPEGFPGSNYEFPTNFAAEPHPIIAGFGAFELDLTYPLWEYGALQAAAVDLLENAGFGFEEN